MKAILTTHRTGEHRPRSFVWSGSSNYSCAWSGSSWCASGSTPERLSWLEAISYTNAWTSGGWNSRYGTLNVRRYISDQIK